MARGTDILTFICLQILILCQTINCQGDCNLAVYPQEVAYRSDNFLHPADGSCSPYTNDSAPNTPSTDPTQYLHCTQPITITNSNRGPPTYTWGTAIGNLLFVFPDSTTFENITVYYIANGTIQGRPKLRIYAVPDSFEVWDEPSEAYPSMVFNERLPGTEEEGVRKVPDSSEGTVSLNTSRVLIQKLTETKTYQFFISEVEFNGSVCNSGTVPTATTVTTVIAGTGEVTDPATSATDQDDTSTVTTVDMQQGSTSGQRSSYEHSHLMVTAIMFALGKLSYC